VQRYGDVPGGAEAHARSVVQRLRPHFAIEVANGNVIIHGGTQVDAATRTPVT